jgi:hypothetical protein
MQWGVTEIIGIQILLCVGQVEVDGSPWSVLHLSHL